MTRATVRRGLVKWSVAALTAIIVLLMATVSQRLGERSRELEQAQETVRALRGNLDTLRADFDAARQRSEEQTRLFLLLGDEVRSRGGDPEIIVVQGARGPQGPAGAPGSPAGSPTGPPTTTSTTAPVTTTTTTTPQGIVTTVCTAGLGQVCPFGVTSTTSSTSTTTTTTAAVPSSP